MRTLYIHELKRLFKSILLWAIIIGSFGVMCIVLYSGMQSEISDMAESFASMGAFSDAFGMSTLSMATMTGYFATEMGTIHGLGIGLFAATLATTILSKEEDLHTGEFLFALPSSRNVIITSKVLAVVTGLTIFNMVTFVLYELGFAIAGDGVSFDLLVKFHALELLLGLEIAMFCLVISAINRTNKLGIGMGIALIFYFFDITSRVIPDLSDYIGIGPYSYANASELFVNGKANTEYLLWGMALTILCLIVTYVIYNRKDLAS